jgi:hypothetical protein
MHDTPTRRHYWNWIERSHGLVVCGSKLHLLLSGVSKNERPKLMRGEPAKKKRARGENE